MARPQKLPDGLKLRGKTYYADFRAGGRRVRKKLSRRLDVAKTLLNDLRGRAERADFDLLDNDYPIADLKEAYLRDLKQTRKPKTVRRYTLSLDTLLSALGAVKVNHIDADAVLRYREDRLRAGCSPRTINHDTTVLKAMLNWGVKIAKVIASNPVKELKALRHDKERQRRPFSTPEVNRLLGVSTEPWRGIWYAFLTTGMRFEELADLRFSDLDWEAREIVIRPEVAKNHKQRRIPMDDRLHGILAGLLEARAARRPGRGKDPKTDAQVKARFTPDHVFVNTENTPLRHRNLYRKFLACCKKAKIEVRTLDAAGNELEHVDIHSFRVTFATDLIERGVDPKTVQELLGHATLDMTMRIYTKIRGQNKRQSIARLSYGAGSQAPEGVIPMPVAAG